MIGLALLLAFLYYRRTRVRRAALKELEILQGKELNASRQALQQTIQVAKRRVRRARFGEGLKKMGRDFGEMFAGRCGAGRGIAVRVHRSAAHVVHSAAASLIQATVSMGPRG